MSRTASIRIRLTEFQFGVLMAALEDAAWKPALGETGQTAARKISERINDRVKWSPKRMGDDTP